MIQTLTKTPLKRIAMLGAVAALALTMSQPSMAASTAPVKASPAAMAHVSAEAMTDVSSQRRRYVRRGGRNYGGAAAAAAFAGIAGAAIIASQNRGYYNDGYYGGRGYYGGGPRYYGGGPGYYGRGYGYRY